MKVTGCLKLASTFYSFLTLSGGATVGLGIWSQMKSKTDLFKTVDVVTLTTIMSMGGPMLIALGCVLALLGVVGCLGTLKKKRWMLLFFFVIVLIIFILHVTVAVFINLPNSVKEKSLSSLESKLVTSLQKNHNQNTSIASIWNETMTKLKCCGYKGYDDFTNSTFVMKHSLYPTQCCGEDSSCGKDKAAKEKVRGCIHVLLEGMVPISGPLSFLIGILEIVALVVSLKVYQCLGHIPL
ncbi:tetraspanin-1-like [Siphateles boraxobius]|uniref:tetraspanin-1-like n=1 Tax=Siphateles boraxobius TaxID=180520 RepID=UPI004063E43A